MRRQKPKEPNEKEHGDHERCQDNDDVVRVRKRGHELTNNQTHGKGGPVAISNPFARACSCEVISIL
jgi:hypothetical protein